MADIASAAQVASGSLYVYFPSKEAIAAALVEDYFSQLTESVLPSTRLADGAAVIAGIVHAALSCAEQNQDILRLCRLDIGLNTMPLAIAAGEQFSETMANVLAEGMEQGTFRRFDPHLLTHWIGRQFEWANEACFIFGMGNVATYERMLTDLLQHALLSSFSP